MPMAQSPRRKGLSRNPWVRDQESRPCRRADCKAEPGQQCVTFSGVIATKPHAERWNDAMASKGIQFQPLGEGHWVSGRGPFPSRKRPEPPVSRYDPGIVAEIMSRPVVKDLIDELEYRRWTGRPGYPIRSLVAAAVARDVYRLRGWGQASRLIGRHDALLEIVRGGYAGLEDDEVVPSEWACYRFAKLLSDEPGLAARLQAATAPRPSRR